MIGLFEFELKNSLEQFWGNVISNLSTPSDFIPYIYSALPADGNFGANQNSVSSMFSSLSSGKNEGKIKFLLQYPANDSHIPCITVEVGDEAELPAIGRYVTRNFNNVTGKWEVSSGAPFAKRYSIGIYTKNPDTTLYLYAFVKYAIFFLNPTFIQTSSATISGRPLAISERFLGEGELVYYRYLDITAEGLVDDAVATYGMVMDAKISNLTVSINLENGTSK